MFKKIWAVIIVGVMFFCTAINAFAVVGDYPYIKDYPDGIENADNSVFLESKIIYPLNNDYETEESINFINNNSSEGQIFISEDAYSGRFAMGLKPLADEKILIRKTDEFLIGNMMNPMGTYSLKTGVNNNVDISIVDKKVFVSGSTEAGNQISIIAYDSSGEIVYVEQLPAIDGAFEFQFSVAEYGTYELQLGNVATELIKSTLIIDGSDVDRTIYDESVIKPQNIETKTNIIKLWVKPKYKAESISFYVTAVCGGEEKPVLIRGSKDNDGVFEVPEDLALGKWQQITLDLLMLDEQPDTLTVKNLYVCANASSEWEIDSISSEYREINSHNVYLEQFAKDNIQYTDDGELCFAKATDTTYSNNSAVVVGSLDVNEAVSGIYVDSEFKKIDPAEGNFEIKTDKLSKYQIPGFSSGAWSGNYKKYFYNNTEDNNYIYCFDTTNYISSKVLDVTSSVSQASYTGEVIMTSDAVYYLEDNSMVAFPTKTYASYFLSPYGEIYAIVGSEDMVAYKYKDGVFSPLCEGGSSTRAKFMLFNPFNNIFVVAMDSSWDIFRNTESGFVYLDSADFENPEETSYAFISNDGSTIYYWDEKNTAYVYDINTDTTIKNTHKYIKQVSDGRFLIDTPYTDYGYYFYNSLTGEEEHLYTTVFKELNYCSERNQLLSISGDSLVVVDLNMNTEYNKYLLSFDGKKTWYSYIDGKWIIASTMPQPTLEELKKKGMTREKINAIPETAFTKIYENGNEVYTLNFAIGMFGSTDYITPVVKSLTVKTIAKQPVDSLYSSKLFEFNKADYTKISGLFPVEDFPNISECYYILYLGNDWIYTYKDGRVIKVNGSVNKLLEDISLSWLDIKQIGLTAFELRSIPGSVLTKLFLNSEFANDIFGVIAITKVKDDSTLGYNIDIKLSGDANYSEEGYALEISLSGSEKLIYLPEDITKEQIDGFLAWLDERQNGNGSIFYRLQTTDKQDFINYYNITNVKVYKPQKETAE